MRSSKYEAGLTLVEMLTVVAIIALLATIVIGTATQIQKQSGEQLTRNTLGLLENALDEYHNFTGGYPEAGGAEPYADSEFLFGELNRVPVSRQILAKIDRSLIANKVDTGMEEPLPEIYDAWGTVVYYRYVPGEDTFPKLESAGPDKDFETANDNIKNID